MIHYVKMKVVRTAVGLVAVLIYFLLFVLVSVQTLGSAIFSNGGRAWKIAVSEDQLFNVSMGGHEDETFSSRCYRDRHKPKYKMLKGVLDWAFFNLTGEENHCYNAYIKETTMRSGLKQH